MSSISSRTRPDIPSETSSLEYIPPLARRKEAPEAKAFDRHET